jgi:hypothetical protein
MRVFWTLGRSTLVAAVYRDGIGAISNLPAIGQRDEPTNVASFG